MGCCGRWDLPAQPFFRSEGQSLATLIAVCTWRGVGYWMFFMLSGLAAIPPEVNEAASIDGAGPWRRLIHITLPLMRRTFAFVLIADTAVNFLLFAPVYIITNGGPNGSTSLLMFEAYRAAFTLLDDGRSLAILLGDPADHRRRGGGGAALLPRGGGVET